MLRLAAPLAIAAGLLAAAPASRGQPAPAWPVEPAERQQVIEDLADVLEANFVLPETGRRYATMLRFNEARGAYDDLTDPAAFGEKVTADLQAVAPDAHLRLATRWTFYRVRMPVGVPPPGQPPPTATPGPPAALPSQPEDPPALESARMIGDVAYLRFNAFPDEPSVALAARTFLLLHANARAVILDARSHRGGGLQVMDAFLPLLYPRPTTLLRLDTRASADDHDRMDDSPTLLRRASTPDVVRRDHVVSPDRVVTGLQRVPVYMLTSRDTASAAEHLAFALKRTHRGVLVGETTRGAARYGGAMPVGARFAVFVPVGRTYDPATGRDWEGKGIAPDVPVPADRALDAALRLARAAGAHPG